MRASRAAGVDPFVTRARTHVWICASGLFALACDGPPPGVALDAGRTDVRESDATGERVRFAIDDGGTLAILDEGDRVDLVWGLQGGTMITPSLLVPTRVTGDAEVTLENIDVGTGARLPDFPGYGPTRIPTSSRDGMTVTAPLYDQLGWAALAEGTQLDLYARVLAGGRVYEGVVRVAIHAPPCPSGSCGCPDAPPECFGPLDAEPESRLDGGGAGDASVADAGAAAELDAGTR